NPSGGSDPLELRRGEVEPAAEVRADAGVRAPDLARAQLQLRRVPALLREPVARDGLVAPREEQVGRDRDGPLGALRVRDDAELSHPVRRSPIAAVEMLAGEPDVRVSSPAAGPGLR